ncbi:MAG: carboxypeptidase regulatory-like domain-containing protein [Bryobacteraceae bacterium]
MSKHSILFAACVLAFPCQTALAQGVTGAILGAVSDPSGARIAGAAVTATNTLTGETRTATANEAGDYLFPVLPVGQYRIEVERQGFKKFVREGIALSVNRNARVDAVLEIGEVSQEVKVVGDVPLVDTRTVQVGGLIDSRRINELVLNGRNIYDLVSMLPGVSSATTPSVMDNSGNFLRVNGSRTRHSTFLLDGNFNNDLYRNSGNEAPNPDAVEEFRLLTSNFSAEYGRSPGAVINVVTRSGTNDYHGAVFEFLRNNKLNARNFFQPAVSPLRQNQFGASLGGRIVRDKLFFFTSYQGLRIRSSEFRNVAITPNAAQRRGNLSDQPAARQPLDPTTNRAFPGGIIPADRLDPVAQNILKLVPLPTTSDGRVEALKPRSQSSDQGLGKLDWLWKPGHKLYGSLFLVRGRGFQPFGGASQIPDYSPIDEILNQHNVAANEDWIVSASLLNQFRFGYTRRYSQSTGSMRTSWSDFGSKVTLGADPPRPPQMYITGWWQMGLFSESHMTQESYNFSDTLSWVRGAHSFKAGLWGLYNKFEEVGSWLGPGQIRFNGDITRNGLSDFLMGRAGSFRQNNGNNRFFRNQNWHAFVQDDWKVHPRVTLNLGLRWELNTPYVSVQDEYQTFRWGARSTLIPKAPLGLVFPGDPGVPRGLIDTDLNNFAPRLGVAFDVFGDGKTAVRAGYGFFYGVGFANTMGSDMQGQPFLVDVTVYGTPNLIEPYSQVPGGSPFPYKLDSKNPLFSLPVTASYLNENFSTPYVQHYTLAIEQQLMHNLGVTLAYVGNASRKLIVQRDANEAIYIPGQSTAGNVNARRPYLPGTIAQISETETASNAHYDSLQMTVNKRFSRGFSVMGNYTFGKSIDEISDDKFNPTALALVDSKNRRLDRAASDADIRHILALSYVWELPRLERWGPFGKQVLGGWQWNGGVRILSGSAMTVTSGRDTNVNGNNNDRPDLVGNPLLPTDRPRAERIAKYFDSAAFRTAPTGSPGNAGRSLIYGPGAMNWDCGIFKNFTFLEKHRVQFRAEFFNFPNRVNLGNPNLTLSNQNVGRILGSGGARVVQFGVKYTF